MTTACFQGILLDGHKELAVEVPFDPAARWMLPARPLRPGRRGHPVRGTLNGTYFESAVVPRAHRFWVTVSHDVATSAGVDVGDDVDVTLEPVELCAIDGDAARRTVGR